jgi:hypothetical protein
LKRDLDIKDKNESSMGKLPATRKLINNTLQNTP